MPNTFLDLFWGYTIIWGLIAGYAVFLMRKQNQTMKRLTQVEQELKNLQAEKKSTSHSIQ